MAPPPSPLVAFQGEPGAFSEAAAQRAFGEGVTTRPCPSFRSTFEALTSGAADRAIVPVENTLGGSILENYDLLYEMPVRIVGECTLRIVHNLIARPGATLDDIRRIYAHPQAAAQCERLLRAHPEWTVFQVYDTAGSVKMIRDQGIADGAAIASARAAEQFGMAIVAAGVQSVPENYTRFVILARADEAPAPPAEGPLKSTLVFGTRNEPGALLRVLEIFEARGVNLTRLESRPIPGRPWEYLFTVDLVGAVGDLERALAPVVTRSRALGVYPPGPDPR